MNAIWMLGNLVWLVSGVLVILASVVALRQVGGMGAILMLIGAIGGTLGSLFWVSNSIGDLLGFSLYTRFDPEKVVQIMGAVSLFAGVSWLMVAVGVMLLTMRMGAMIKRSAVLTEIRAGQG